MDGQEAADTYSARAGFSEHQTGLVLDLNTVDISFDNTNESNWLRDNSYKYGFIIRYPKGKENITGYTYEPWHIRYVGKNLAKEIYNNGDYLTLEEYFGIDSNYQ
jgi:zinc D-Ala-D-Ala carboxypeptidase